MTEPFEREPYTELETELYYRWQFARLKTGESLFIVRNFAADFGRVYDYYSYAGKVAHLGYVHDDYEWGCTAYRNVENHPQPLNSEPLRLDEAKQLLTDKVQEERNARLH